MGALGFLHPWLLAGLVGASLPVLIHWIGKRRAPVVRFAAFDFLLAVTRRLARRERLRQILLLTLRTLAILAVVLALARPLPEQAAAVPTESRRVAIVFDRSASMRYLLGGTSLFERGKRKARDVLSHLGPGDAATLISAGREVKAELEAPTVDLDVVRRAIEALPEPEGVADLGAALELAQAQLAAGGAGTMLVIVSDLAENGFVALRPSALDPAPEVRLVDVAEREGDPLRPLGNAAIESVRVLRSEESSAERRFEVVVRNYGDTEIASRPLELLLNGELAQRGFVTVPPRATMTKVLTHRFVGTGLFEAEARLGEAPDDGFAEDDHAGLVTLVAPGVRVLAVDGDPRTTPYEDELYFFERALQSVPRGEAALELRIVTVDELAAEPLDATLAEVQVVVLANVGSLPAGVTRALSEFVARGGGLLMTLGESVRFERANEELAAILPHPLRDLHQAADEAAGTPPLGLGDLDVEHPILHGLGTVAVDSLRASKTAAYFNLDVGAGLKSRPILRFENGAPALVERRAGVGRLMMLTTTIDVDASDLPLRSAFPPLLQRLVRYLGGALAEGSVEPVRAGAIARVAVPTGAEAIAIVDAEGQRRELEVSQATQGRVEVDGLDVAGKVAIEVKRGAWEKAPALALIVNPSLAESDFAPVRSERLSEALGGKAVAAVPVMVGATAGTDPFEQRGFAPYLLLLLGLLFVGESLLASRG